MQDGTTIYEFHGQILRDTFGCDLTDSDAFLLFALFHHYQIELSGAVVTDRPNLKAGDRIHAHTQRGCAAALASIWLASEDERADCMYWYRRWNGDWGSYGHAENLNNKESDGLRSLIQKLERHPYVRRFLPEDDDLFDRSA